MNDRLSYIYLSFWVFCLVFITFSSEAQQLKLGSDPTQINKAALLELKSPNQGLLLSRVNDTSEVNHIINALSTAQKHSTNGMLVFQKADSSLYIRSGGYWRKLAIADHLGIIFLNGDKTKKQTLSVIYGDSYNKPDPPIYHYPTIVDDKLGNHILYLPYASVGFDGLVSNDSQTWVGSKKFLDPIGIESLTSGSIPFIGEDPYNYLSEDNDHLFWDNTNQRLGIGTHIPTNTLTVNSETNNESGLTLSRLTSSSPVDNDAKPIGVDDNGKVVRVDGGLQELNGLSNLSQTFKTGINGDDFHITSSSGVHTFNLPDASTSVRGVVNKSNQSFGGNKTFHDNVEIDGTAQIGSGGTPLTSIIRKAINKDVENIPGSSYLDVDFDIVGATVGSTVMVSPEDALPENCSIGYARVKSLGIVEVRFINNNETKYNITSTYISLLGLTLLKAATEEKAQAIDPPPIIYHFTIIK